MIAAVAIFAIIALMPTPSGLTYQGQLAIAIIAFGLILWIAKPVNLVVSSLIVMGLLAALKVVDTHTALSGFSASSTWLIAGGLILGMAISKVELDKKIIRYVLVHTGVKGPFGAMMAVFLMNLIFAFFIPSTTARTAILLPISVMLIRVLGIPSESKFAQAILLETAFLPSSIGSGLLTGSAMNPLGAGLITEVTGHTVTYFEWMSLGMPFALIISIFIVIYLRLTFKGGLDQEIGKDFFNIMLEKKPWTPEQKRVTVIFIFTIILWATDFIHGISVTIVCLISAALLLFPGIGVLKWETDSKQMNWGIIFLLAATMSAATALIKTHAIDWIAMQIIPFVKQINSPLGILLFFYTFSIILNKFINNNMATTALMIPLTYSTVMDLGLNPMPFLWAVAISANISFITPIETLPNLLVYERGCLKFRTMAIHGTIITIVSILVIMAVVLLYWPIFGLYV